MEERFRYAKYLFFIEGLLGTNVVSFNIRSKKHLKQLFSSCILFVWSVYVSYNLHSIVACSEVYLQFKHAVVLAFLRDLYIGYVLVMCLYKPDTKGLLATNLSAIEEYLVGLNINVPMNTLESANAVIGAVNFLIHFMIVTVFDVLYPEGLVEPYMIILYWYTIKCSLQFGCTVFLAKFIRIQKAIYDEFRKILRHLNEETILTEARPYVIRIRVAWTENSEFRRRNLTALKTILSTLSTVEQDMQDCYFVYVCCISITTALIIPSYIYHFSLNGGQSFLLNVFLIVNVWFVASILCLQTLNQAVKKSTVDTLTKLLATDVDEENRHTIRHQLQHMYLHSEPFTCYFFDVDVSFLITVLETILLVVVTMRSETPP